MTPYLPITAQQMVDESLAAAEAGASILHLHARDPDTGLPSSAVGHFMDFLPDIKQQCDAVVNITTGGSAVMTLEQRLAAPIRAEPEMCSVNMGTMNFALYPAVKRISDWKHDWEKPFLENIDDLVFKNTPRDIAHVMLEMGEKRGVRFEFECYDLSHLYMLNHFVERGLAKAPLFIQFVFGVLGGHVRVGLEDSVYIGPGERAKSNADQVQKIREIAEKLGRTIATPTQARQLLTLKGHEQTAF